MHLRLFVPDRIDIPIIQKNVRYSISKSKQRSNHFLFDVTLAFLVLGDIAHLHNDILYFLLRQRVEKKLPGAGGRP